MDNTSRDITTAPLESLTDKEWEALCDHCGRCCLIKLEDEDSHEVFYTNIICRMYDIPQGQCSCYSSRKQQVPDCVVIRQFDDEIYAQLPQTCAYRLRYNQLPLPQWHPLIVGNTEKMKQAGIFIHQRVVSEQAIHESQFEEHISDDIK